MRVWFLGASALLLAGTSVKASAQSAVSASNEAPGEIVVTAQRRNEKLSDVPISVSAINSEDLSRAGIRDTSRLQLLAPGLTWGQQGSDSFPAIRGVRTQLVSAQSDPVIGFYIDGVYQSRTQQQSFPLFDVNRVEVLRGPQGTLYGRNTFGGNISVITQGPQQDYAAGFNAQVGNYAQRQIDAFVNLPVADTLQLRVAGYHSERDGYVRSSTTPGLSLADDGQSAARASLKYTPTSDLEILLHAAYWERKDNGGGAYGYKVAGTLIDPATGTRSILGKPYVVNPTAHNGTAVVNGVDIGVPVTGNAWTNQWDYQPFEDLKAHYFTGQLNYDLGPVVFRSITGYNKFRANRSADLDQSSVLFPAAGVTYGFTGSGLQAADTDVKSFSQEFQLASDTPGAPLEWIVGGYYLSDKITELYSQVYTASTATALSSRSRTAIDTKAYALFGQATYSLIPDQLKLIGGVRYSDETKKYNITNFTAPTQTWNFNTQTAAQATGQAKYSKVTWRGGLEFKPTVGTMFYATVSTGFESGGINNNSSNAAIPQSYAPQTVTAYEVGSKSTLLDRRVFLNLSAFYNTYRNLQITILDPSTNLSYYASAGAARSYGLEADIKTVPVPGLHLDMTAAFLNAKFTSYVRPNPFGNTTTVNLADKKVPMSPSLKSTVSLYYEADLGAAGKLSPRVDWLHSSSYFSTDYNTVLDRQDAYDIVDLGLRWTEASGRTYVEGFMTNVGNTPVIYSATLGNSARIQVSYGPPKTYGVRVGTKF